MSTSDTNPVVSNTDEFGKIALSRVKLSALDVLDPILFVLRVTVVYLVFLAGDILLLKVIGWSFGDIIRPGSFADTLLWYIQVLSALGTATAYVLHLLVSFLFEAKHLVKAGNIEKEKSS